MLAICAGIAVGFMVARGGNDGDWSEDRNRDVVSASVSVWMGEHWSLYDGAVGEDYVAGASGDEVAFGAPTRLVIGGLATADGEPEVTAAAVEPTRDIVEPTPTAAISSPVGPADIIALIVQYDWPDDTAIAIADCESDFNPNAVNPQPVVLNNGVNHASGVFQLLMPLHQSRLDGASPFNAEANIRAAYGMWLTDGWGPWKECW